MALPAAALHLGSKHAQAVGRQWRRRLQDRVLRRQQGRLTIGCHGPGAPHGIFEGIATTKGYMTYYNVPNPALGVDAGRTNFHVR